MVVVCGGDQMTPLNAEYKDFYARELQRREELNGSIERPMAIITALVGVLYFCLHDLSSQLTLLTGLQIVVGLGAGGLLVAAVVEIVRSNYDHTYGLAPTPKALEDYRLSLTDYHATHCELPADRIEQKVIEHVYSAYAKAGHQNAVINDQRSAHLHRAKKRIIYALPVILALAALRLVGSSQFSGWFSDLAVYMKGIVV